MALWRPALTLATYVARRKRPAAERIPCERDLRTHALCVNVFRSDLARTSATRAMFMA